MLKSGGGRALLCAIWLVSPYSGRDLHYDAILLAVIFTELPDEHFMQCFMNSKFDLEITLGNWYVTHLKTAGYVASRAGCSFQRIATSIADELSYSHRDSGHSSWRNYEV